jgi:hypothetical protein
MYPLLRRFTLLITLLVVFGCSSDTSAPPAGSTVSSNTAVFDPGSGNVPLPNILATATAADPLTGRAANRPMTPPEALAYVNLHEMGNTNAVAGLNAPIYIRFQRPVDPATVTPATVKVFQLGIDANGLTETSPLSFSDISAMFDFSYSAGGTDLLLFPKFPLLPGLRYLYVVTNGVKDAATGGSLSGSFFFEALKATTPLLGAFAGLDPIRANVYADPPANTVVKLSGYAKVMDDLIASSSATKVTSRASIALLGRFITTGAGFIATDAANPATRIPVESALRAFAARGLTGGFPGTPWGNDTTFSTIPPDSYWSAVMGAATAAPATVASVVTGNIRSAELSMDPAIVAANGSVMDLSAFSGAYNPAAGVTQPFRSGANLLGYYHTARNVPFVYIAPRGTAPAAGWPLAIFQHGIAGQKEQVIAVAGSLTAAGYAVVAVDLPLHGALAVPGHTSGAAWGQDFMAVGAPLATRSNIQQAALNLNRLEFALVTGGFATLGADAPNRTTVKPKFIGFSLGSIVGAYYLAGNTLLDPAAAAPYTQSTLNSDMKGFLSVPGGRLAYLLQNSPAFSGPINAGLLAAGISQNTPTYHNFFQVTQSIIDPVDPATMTTPLAAGLPSRLSGRIAIQEATSTTFDAAGLPTNGDLVITNTFTRYFGNALGGREVLGSAAAAVAPGFKQLGYLGAATPRIPSSFMFTLAAGSPVPKTDFAAALNAATTIPSEGYFQFDQSGVSHGFLLDPTNSPAATGLAQTQMVHFLLRGAVVDPTSSTPGKAVMQAPLTAPEWKIGFPATFAILGY